MSDAPIGSRKSFGPLPGGGYAYTLLDNGVRIELRELRREHGHLHVCDFNVLCDWAGAKTVNGGSLSRAYLDASSQSARKTTAKHCAERARSTAEVFDFMTPIDDACIQTIAAEHNGTPDLVLDDAPDAGPPRDVIVHGVAIAADSHTQLIADGGGLKSLLQLLILGDLAAREIPVLYCDWEWNASRHLGRKRRLLGPDRLEHLHYMQCRNPLAVELDHIRRAVDTHHIQLVGLDSIGAGVEGKLADDDVARGWNQAIGHLPATLAAAHIPKSTTDPAVDAKAFGSAFFHNFCRVSYTVKKQAASDDVVTVGLFPSKQNDGARYRPVGLTFTFTPERITVQPADLADVEGLADRLSIADRMRHALKRGPRTYAELSSDLDAKLDTVIKAATRGKAFTKLLSADGITRIALVARERAS